MAVKFTKYDFLDAICLSPKVAIHKGDEIPFVEMANVATGNRKDPVAIEMRKFSGGTKFERNDTVIASIEPCLQHGKSFYFTEHDKGAGSTEYLVFRGIDGITTNEFVYYFMMSYEIREAMIRSMKGATGRQRVDPEVFTGLKIELPDVPTQNKIVAVLSDYDAAITNCRKQIALLEEAAMRLYREWFGDGKGEKKSIADISETIGGGTPSTSKAEYWDGDIPWVVPTDITRNSCLSLLSTEKRITKLGLEKSSAKMLPAKAILMTSRASVGYFGIADFPVCTNQGFISIVPHDEKMRWYLLFNLITRVEEIRAKAKGATFAEISKSSFRALDVVIPERAKLLSFDNIATGIMKSELALDKQIRFLAEARDRLLPKLMKGKIEV